MSIEAKWEGIVPLSKAMDRGRPQEIERCSSTCTCTVQSTIQLEIGFAVVKIGFVIGGHSEHTRRQHSYGVYLTLYVLTTAHSGVARNFVNMRH